MYQLPDKPKGRILFFLIGYHYGLSRLYNKENIWDSKEARDDAENYIYDTKDNLPDKSDEKDEYFYILGRLWACHDYLEGADQ